ncbi:FAD-binding oxidoreductase [Coraliomargarita sp. SDUM461003]|uniref:FAD-binding oxidoreductase n=1 Tax=Thalassobacterium maritimum TaxID=3041265 RepID=A0ABU1AX72_9BACT|nr:FAD-binding oxidoreductase [Coraliomargarita sp. SDUM461003]MDQ8208768.1 FAD-binding oxidoreductase [Coraliomargarita sp. SDUM461003]
MELNTAFLSQLASIVGETSLITSETSTLKLSRDYAWYSPFLKESLASKRADAVVKVTSEEALEQIIATCVAEEVPVTIRGATTGNYGQCTPFEGGVLIDINGLNEIIEIGDGWVEAQAGVRIQTLENAVRKEGWELRSYPSTWVRSTLSGYIGGGSGGIGSVTWGRLQEAGTIKAVDLLTVENPPRKFRLEEEETRKVHHTYGTNGISTRITLRLAPKADWRQIMVTSEDWWALMEFAVEMADDKTWNKRLISVHEWPIPSYFKGLKKWIRSDSHLIFFEIEESQSEAFKALVAERGLSVQHEIEPHEPRKAPMYSDFTYNHTTLWALKFDPSYSYMANRFDPTNYKEKMLAIKEKFPDELWWHLEILRDYTQDEPIYACLTIFRYTTPERFTEMREFMQSIGVPTGSAHTPYLDQGMHIHDLDDKLAVKDYADPKGLLNPGKLQNYQPGSYGNWAPESSKN